MDQKMHDKGLEVRKAVLGYGGMPAAVDSFRIAREFFAEMDKA